MTQTIVEISKGSTALLNLAAPLPCYGKLGNTNATADQTRSSLEICSMRSYMSRSPHSRGEREGGGIEDINHGGSINVRFILRGYSLLWGLMYF